MLWSLGVWEPRGLGFKVLPGLLAFWTGCYSLCPGFHFYAVHLHVSILERYGSIVAATNSTTMTATVLLLLLLTTTTATIATTNCYYY